MSGSDTQAQLDIAVVGGGIAGMSAALMLAERHRVTLYEANPRLGGHANTALIELDEQSVPIDTGFIVYNNRNYPHLIRLFDWLKINTAASDMSFGVSLRDGALEYSGTDLNGLFAQRRNAFNPRFWRMLSDIRRFYAAAGEYMKRYDNNISIGELLLAEAYGEAFFDDHLMPMAAAIWSASRVDIAAYPAAAFLRFFDNHGLISLHNRPSWRTVEGGSVSYVNAVSDRLGAGVKTNMAVQRIERDPRGVSLHCHGGVEARHDKLVLATHADQALAMLARPSSAEQALLGAFRYSRNTAWLHCDKRLMPQRRAAWSSWNYLQETHSDTAAALCVTYWMNNLQPLNTSRNVFVTLNPLTEPEPELVHGVYDYTHPVFDTRTAEMQQRSAELQGQHHTWYCGAHFGHGFHEDGIQSGLWVAEKLGAPAPWRNEVDYNRIPETYLAEPREAA